MNNTMTRDAYIDVVWQENENNFCENKTCIKITAINWRISNTRARFDI